MQFPEDNLYRFSEVNRDLCKKNNNETCSTHSDCWTRFCDSNFTCAPTKPNGEVCEINEECENHLCFDGHCSRKWWRNNWVIRANSVWTLSISTSYWTTFWSIYAGKRFNGETCFVDAECDSGYCDLVSSPPRCTPCRVSEEVRIMLDIADVLKNIDFTIHGLCPCYFSSSDGESKDRWPGITCDDSREHVTGIEWSNRNITQDISVFKELSRLPFLSILDLSQNHITGIKVVLPKLQYIYIYSEMLCKLIFSLMGALSFHKVLWIQSLMDGVKYVVLRRSSLALHLTKNLRKLLLGSIFRITESGLMIIFLECEERQSKLTSSL